MDKSCRIALAESLWRATLATLAATIVVICVIPDRTSAFLAGAIVAIVYALLNILAALQLKGDAAREPEWVSSLFLRQRTARVRLHETFTPPGMVMLRFAEIGAATAIALSAAALVG
jgi:hypothetical protein